MGRFPPLLELPATEIAKNMQNYADAYNSRVPTYEGYCSWHGWAIFYTQTKKCSDCSRAVGRPFKKEKRAEARRNNLTEYSNECEIHGMTEFSVGADRCLKCFTTNGRLRIRPQGDTARSDARKAGAQTFVAACPMHGLTAHSVVHGRCLACFTTGGVLRNRTPVALSARAYARRKGETVYIDWCERHGGPSEFSVHHGKCLVCFNTNGARRPT